MVNPNQPPDKRLCLGHSVTATENGPRCGEPWKRGRNDGSRKRHSVGSDEEEK